MCILKAKKKPSTKDCPELECSVVDGFLTLIGNIRAFGGGRLERLLLRRDSSRKMGLSGLYF